MIEPKKGDWFHRPGGPAHRVEQVSVSRANLPMGVWVLCGKHMMLTLGVLSSNLKPADEQTRLCKHCGRKLDAELDALANTQPPEGQVFTESSTAATKPKEAT